LKPISAQRLTKKEEIRPTQKSFHASNRRFIRLAKYMLLIDQPNRLLPYKVYGKKTSLIPTDTQSKFCLAINYSSTIQNRSFSNYGEQDYLSDQIL